MTQYQYQWENKNEFEQMKPLMADMIQEKLIEINEQGFKVTDFGHPFLRNICSLFDDYIPQKRPDNGLFSKSI